MFKPDRGLLFWTQVCYPMNSASGNLRLSPQRSDADLTYIPQYTVQGKLNSSVHVQDNMVKDVNELEYKSFSVSVRRNGRT